MALHFFDIVDKIAAGIPPKLQKFLHRADRPFEITWDYYAYCYGRAFEELSTAALARDHFIGNLMLPLVSTGRHSIELVLKAAIQEYSECDITCTMLREMQGV